LNFGKFLGGPDISGTSNRQIRSLVLFNRTNPVLLPDISGEDGQIRSKTRYVCHTFSAVLFNDCFERNLLIVSLIDLILLLLAS
jgi:hypothetical protein